MKTLLIIGAVVVLLVVVALAVVATHLDSVIKAGVEAVGPDITGTTVPSDQPRPPWPLQLDRQRSSAGR